MDELFIELNEQQKIRAIKGYTTKAGFRKQIRELLQK